MTHIFFSVEEYVTSKWLAKIRFVTVNFAHELVLHACPPTHMHEYVFMCVRAHAQVCLCACLFARVCGMHLYLSVCLSVTDSCTFHPGAPFFHDAYKGWSCCKKKCTDFTEFLNIKVNYSAVLLIVSISVNNFISSR
jgi:hypothetical protein